MCFALLPLCSIFIQTRVRAGLFGKAHRQSVDSVVPLGYTVIGSDQDIGAERDLLGSRLVVFARVCWQKIQQGATGGS